MPFIYPHKPDSKSAPSSENDKPAQTAKEAHNSHRNSGKPPTGWPK